MDVIDLLIFSAGNLVFGAWAQQIEELLKAERPEMPAEAAEEYITFYRQRELRVVNLAKRLKLGEANEQQQRTDTVFTPQPNVTYSLEHPCHRPETSGISAKILVIKRQECEYTGIQVESVQQLVTTTLHQIYALPKILEKQKQIAGLCGLVFLHGKVVVLLDLTQFT